jgi:hypothetical protein
LNTAFLGRQLLPCSQYSYMPWLLFSIDYPDVWTLHTKFLRVYH